MKKSRLQPSKDLFRPAGGGVFDCYHLYNRGIDNRSIFTTQGDFDRFKAYLYLLNDAESPRAANFFVGNRAADIYTNARAEPLIAIGAFCLMQNHFQIVARPLVENGIARFMQKLITAYTMYYNDRTYRKGGLFQGTYKRKRLENDAELKYTFSYLHFTPAEFFEPEWRSASPEELKFLQRKIATYPYSSAHEYAVSEYVITAPEFFPGYLRGRKCLDAHREFLIRYRNEIRLEL